MDNIKTKIKSFTDLNAWKEGHKLVLLIYKLTANFPAHEVFGLTNQMRRAVVSVTSNIAERFRRNTNRDKVQFYTMAHGSLMELQNKLVISRDLAYIKEDDFNFIAEKTITTSKLISGLKRVGSS